MNRLIQIQIQKAHKKIQLMKDSGELDVDAEEDANNNEGGESDEKDGSSRSQIVEVQLKLTSAANNHMNVKKRKLNTNVFENDDNDENPQSFSSSSSSSSRHTNDMTSSSYSHSHSNDPSNHKLSNIEKLILEEENQKKQVILGKYADQDNRKDYWLHEGIVVKVKNKKLKDGKYYNQKGIVQRVIDRYIAGMLP